MTTHQRFATNTAGADWVVGDVHGCFTHLETALRAVGFDAAADRLFSVGDLVDRGPESAAAIEWVGDGRIRGAVKGNHEALMQRALSMPRASVPDRMWRENGGGWGRSLRDDAGALARWRAWLDALPLALTIETAHGRIAVIHAQAPAPTWDESVALLESEGAEGEHARVRALWSRLRYGVLQHEFNEYRSDHAGGCADCRLVMVGHTPLRAPDRRENVVNLDTGAAIARGDYGRLTLAQVNAAALRVVSVTASGEAEEHALDSEVAPDPGPV